VALTLLWATAVLCGLTLPGTAAGASESQRCNEDVVLRADYFDADIKSDTTMMDNVVITHCDIRVEAKRASATGNLDFDDTRLTLNGDVRITVENRGQLLSDEAVVLFRNNQLARATVTGNPAEFEQRREASGLPARGHADEIVYDVGAGTVRFENDAWFHYGTTEMKGPSLVYNIREEKVQGTRASGERVRITVTPKSTPPKEPAEAPPAADSPSGPAPQAPRAP